MLELKHTVDLMLSDNYKDRLLAEYWQVHIRIRNLMGFLLDNHDKIDKADEQFLDAQRDIMDVYRRMLEKRCQNEGIDCVRDFNTSFNEELDAPVIDNEEDDMLYGEVLPGLYKLNQWTFNGEDSVRLNVRYQILCLEERGVKMNVNRIAKDCNLNTNTLYRWMRGEVSMKYSDIEKIVHYLADWCEQVFAD